MSVSKMDYSHGSMPIFTLIAGIKSKQLRDKIDLNPEYQRGFIWNNDFKDKLIYSIIKRYPIGNISLRDTEKNGIPYREVVDGKQRLATIYGFAVEGYEVKGDIARKIIEYLQSIFEEETENKANYSENDIKILKKLFSKLKNKGKISFKFKDLPDFLQYTFNSYNVAITKLFNATDSEIREYFTYLQNQERLRAGEIINSVDYSFLETYLDGLDLDSLLKIFKFKNNRDQFKRVFYSIVGLIDDKIGFGVTDKIVIKYASECKGVSPITLDCIERLKFQIKSLCSNVDKWVLPYGFNVRALKFFILLSCFNYVDFSKKTKEKLMELDQINHKLSCFSSAKQDSVGIEFEGYSRDVVEEYRLIALVSKGGHAIPRVKNRMEILSYYINHYNDPNAKVAPSNIVVI